MNQNYQRRSPEAGAESSQNVNDQTSQSDNQEPPRVDPDSPSTKAFVAILLDEYVYWRENDNPIIDNFCMGAAGALGNVLMAVTTGKPIRKHVEQLMKAGSDTPPREIDQTAVRQCLEAVCGILPPGRIQIQVHLQESDPPVPWLTVNIARIPTEPEPLRRAILSPGKFRECASGQWVDGGRRLLLEHDEAQRAVIRTEREIIEKLRSELAAREAISSGLGLERIKLRKDFNEASRRAVAYGLRSQAKLHDLKELVQKWEQEPEPGSEG